MSDESHDAVLLKSKFPGISDEMFDLFLAECRQRKLNPWLGHLYPKIIRDHSTGAETMRPIVTLNGMRVLANNTGLYAGQTEPEWSNAEGVWAEIWYGIGIKNPPFAARVGVYRRGIDGPSWGIAKWDEAAQGTMKAGGEKEYDEFWRKMPSHMLMKVAESHAFRKAFPETLGGLFLEGELLQQPNAVTGDRPADATDEPYIERESPTTEFQFQAALIEMGLSNPDRRRRTISDYERKYAELHMDNPTAFYASVLRDIGRAKLCGNHSA